MRSRVLGNPQRPRWFVAILTSLTLINLSWAIGQGVEEWSIQPGSLAGINAATRPSHLTNAEHALFVVCDDNAPLGLNVIAVFGYGHGATPPEQMEVWFRSNQDAIVYQQWLVWNEEPDRAIPSTYGEVQQVVEALRQGGTIAFRFIVNPEAFASTQPTFSYQVADFDDVEERLACARGSTADPFADAPTSQAPGATDPMGTPARPDSTPTTSAGPVSVAVTHWQLMNTNPANPYVVSENPNGALAFMCVGPEIIAGFFPTHERLRREPRLRVRLSGEPRELDFLPTPSGGFSVELDGDVVEGSKRMLVAAMFTDPFTLATSLNGNLIEILRVTGRDTLVELVAALPCAPQ